MNTGEFTWTCLYTDNWAVVNSWLREAVCRQRLELWVRVGYMKLSVDRFMKHGPNLVLILWQYSSTLTVFYLTVLSLSTPV